ncbi:unnamed protein product [Caenorhabditis brenneri]
MDARFPLLKLPEKACRRVVQVMDTHEILGFSLITKKCKDFTISLKIKAEYLSVSIGNKISISLLTTHDSIYLNFYTEPRLYWIIETDGQKKTLKPPESVVVDLFSREDLKWKNTKDFGMKEWLEHIHTVFDFHNINRIIFEQNASCFDIDYVKETFRNAEGLSVYHSGSYEYNESILKKLLPTECLFIEVNAFPDSKIPSTTLIQNFESLEIKYQEVGLKFASLDELLMINSKFIHISTYQNPSRILNKFIKLWKNGANSRMKRFEIIYRNGSETDSNVVFNGIGYDEVPKERLLESNPKNLVNKGFDIYRTDGTKAMIRLEYTNLHGGLSRFRMML